MSLSIFPFSQGEFFLDTYFDGPVVHEVVQRSNGSVEFAAFRERILQNFLGSVLEYLVLLLFSSVFLLLAFLFALLIRTFSYHLLSLGMFEFESFLDWDGDVQISIVGVLVCLDDFVQVFRRTNLSLES